MGKSIVFIDTEVSIEDNQIHDIGAVRYDGSIFHSSSVKDFFEFISGMIFVCGHNIIHHDLKYIHSSVGKKITATAIDTLYLSPLLFPKHPYHALLKDDKLQVEEFNNPVNDCQKSEKLFYDEVNAFFALSPELKQIFCHLLYSQEEFKGFFDYVNFKPYNVDVKN